MPLYARTILLTAVPAEADEAMKRHLDHLAELDACGKLYAAGELANGEGFLDVLAVKDRLEAEALTRESPLVEAGLAAWTVREWTRIETF